MLHQEMSVILDSTPSAEGGDLSGRLSRSIHISSLPAAAAVCMNSALPAKVSSQPGRKPLRSARCGAGLLVPGSVPMAAAFQAGVRTGDVCWLWVGASRWRPGEQLGCSRCGQSQRTPPCSPRGLGALVSCCLRLPGRGLLMMVH